MADTDLKDPKDSRPVPDPTILTTQQLNREILSLKEVIFTRLDGMDKAIEVFNDNITRVPTDTDKQISHLKELHEEKFESIEVQFKERDTRTEQTARDSKVAVDAALQAAKEAVGEQNKSSALAISKSEAATVKQIDQIQILIASSVSGLDDKIADIKDRLTRIEGGAVGKAEAFTTQVTTTRGQHDSNTTTIAIIATVISAISLVIVALRIATGH